MARKPMIEGSCLTISGCRLSNSQLFGFIIFLALIAISPVADIRFGFFYYYMPFKTC